MHIENLGKDYPMTVKIIQGVYTELDLDGVIVVFDSYLEHPIGYTPDEIRGKYLPDVFVSMEVEEKSPITLQNQILKNGKQNYLSKIQTEAGEFRYIEWRFKRVRDSNRKVHVILGVGQDVSFRVTNEEKLHQRHLNLTEKIRILTCMYRIAQMAVDDSHSFDTTLQAIVDLIPQAFDCPESVAASIRFDKNSYQTPGFDSSQNRYGKDIVIKEDLKGRVEIGCKENGKAIPYTKKVYSAEEIKLMESAARKVAYIIERKEANEKKKVLEEQLRHADRLATIGQLAAGIAHELNNPLGDILGFAQLASNYPDLPEQVYQDLVKIVKSTLYAREVIKKVLFFSRQTLPREAKANLNRLIEDWVDFFEFRCAQNNIEIVLEMDENLPSVTGDPAQLNQVLINLVVNAIHAMPEGGILTIKTTVKQGSIAMLVQDTGQGISEDIKDNIFLPFFTTKEVDKGTGLGLSVVYGIVNEHGGTVRVDSQTGSGSIFEVELPI